MIRLLAVSLVLWGAAPAVAEEPLLTWYVADGDDAEAWRAAAEPTWPAGSLQVTDWPGPLPPIDAPLPHAYYEGSLPGGEVVLRDADGERRMPVVLDGGGDDEARRAALLVLRHIAAPLGVTDGGWTPPPPPLPEPVSVPRGPPARLRLGLGAGVGFRPGLDTPCLLASVRVEVAPGELWPHPVGILVEASGDLFASADLGEVTVRLDGVAALAGVEVRPTRDFSEFHFGVAGGARWLWARRADGAGELSRATLPCLAGWVGVRRVAVARLRLGVRIRVEIEPGRRLIQLRAGSESDVAEVESLVVGLQFIVDLGA